MGKIYQRLKNYSESDFYPFHMPGHKRNSACVDARLPYEIDITEIEGFDDLHHSEGLLRDAQKRAARLYHADETYYLINGSTVGLLCAILGVTNPQDTILMARNCHKSVYNAVFLNQLNPIYIYPKLLGNNICEDTIDKQIDGMTMTENKGDDGKIYKGHEYSSINGEINCYDLERQLSEHKNVKAVVITSPTYEGVVSNIKEIADITHKYGIPLIVDEAHGAHFGFHSYFPQSSISLGADLVIHSLHKTMPSLTQTALLHINGQIVDRQKVRKYLSMLQSSSPSYVLMASIDECVSLLEDQKDTLFESYVSKLHAVRSRLKKLRNLKLVDAERYDPSKIVIECEGCWIKESIKFTGRLLCDTLRNNYLIESEMASTTYVVLMTSLADTEEGFQRLVNALFEIDQNLYVCEPSNDGETKDTTVIKKRNKFYCNPRKSEMLKEQRGSETVGWKDAQGRVSLEYAYVYPPGIPLIVPGEIISADVLECILNYKTYGFKIEGTKNKDKIEVLRTE